MSSLSKINTLDTLDPIPERISKLSSMQPVKNVTLYQCYAYRMRGCSLVATVVEPGGLLTSL